MGFYASKRQLHASPRQSDAATPHSAALGNRRTTKASPERAAQRGRSISRSPFRGPVTTLTLRRPFVHRIDQRRLADELVLQAARLDPGSEVAINGERP